MSSTAMADRLELERMLRSLDPGDIVTVTKLDRLGRSTRDLAMAVSRPVSAACGEPSAAPGP
jgi:DNA invertase Pin-like site-specific DNA recombinase